MRSRFTYIGSAVIEVVVDGDSLTWNVLQPEIAAAAPVAPLEAALPPESLLVPAAAPEEPSSTPVPDVVGNEMTLMAAPLGEPVPIESPYTKKQRTVMGMIRAGWFAVFSGAGAVVDYGIANFTDLPVPPGTATFIGMGLAFIKRAVWPDTKF